MYINYYVEIFIFSLYIYTYRVYIFIYLYVKVYHRENNFPLSEWRYIPIKFAIT